jgi:type VII secretion protein EccB
VWEGTVSMYGRREQVEAHSFLTGRITASVLRTDPDSADRPLRRTTVGMAGGIGISLLVIAVVLIVSLVTGRSGETWRKPGTLIVDEDTGNRYLMVGDRLRPVLNYASARLLVGGDPPVVSVSSKDMASVPKGAPIGIAGAPDSMPSAGASAQPWTVCGDVRDGDPVVAVTVGSMRDMIPARAEDALLVRAGGEMFLAWQGTRLRITKEWAPRALGLDPTAAMPVDSAWLNALPAGPDLGAPPVERGGLGPVIAGQPTTVGQLVSAPDAVGDTTFVVAEDGLMPVTETVATLLTADPDAEQVPPFDLSPAQLAAQKVLPAPVGQAALPAKPPAVMDDARVPCVQWKSERVTLASVPSVKWSTRDSDPAGITRDGRVADVVDVSPGAGHLARTRPAPGVPGAGLYLVTEAGAKFPVANGDAAEALGFSVGAAALVPAELMALLPTGPVLDVLE